MRLDKYICPALLECRVAVEGRGRNGEVVSGATSLVTHSTDETTSWLSPPGGGPIPQTSYPGTQRGNNTWCSVDYAEGLFVGYRFYDGYPETAPPLFPFGHGLSCACITNCRCRCCSLCVTPRSRTPARLVQTRISPTLTSP